MDLEEVFVKAELKYQTRQRIYNWTSAPCFKNGVISPYYQSHRDRSL